MKPLVFDSFISSYASCFAEPLLSRVLKRVERTVGEHRCFFWQACRDACAFEGNEEFWAENIRKVDPFFTTIESEALN